MKLKIFKKLFYTTAGVLFITLTLVFLLLSIAVNNAVADDSEAQLNSICEETIEAISGGSFGDAEKIVWSLSKVNKTDIYVADFGGRIILCSCEDYRDDHSCIHTNTFLSKHYLKTVSTTGRFELSSIGGMLDKMSYSYSVKTSGAMTNYVIATTNIVSFSELMKFLFGVYIASAILPLLFMFVMEYGIVYRLTRPLKYMSVAAKSIANGDFSKRIPVMSNDEIGELSILFNRMTDSLSRTERTGRSFVANVSHELKTPMTTISGFIDGIIDGTIDESRRDHYLKIVSDEVKRMARLVQSMLSLTRLEFDEKPLNETEFRLSDTVTNVVMSMEQKITEKNIDIIGLDSLSNTMYFGDMDLIHQVVYNLTDNAVKFTDIGGKIEFQLHRIENNLEFKIRNSGNGIPQADLPHIFESFYKIDKSRSTHKESLGLGLYICKTVTELHGGSIKVDSNSVDYTEFTVTLPINK